MYCKGSHGSLGELAQKNTPNEKGLPPNVSHRSWVAAKCRDSPCFLSGSFWIFFSTDCSQLEVGNRSFCKCAVPPLTPLRLEWHRKWLLDGSLHAYWYAILRVARLIIFKRPNLPIVPQFNFIFHGLDFAYLVCKSQFCKWALECYFFMNTVTMGTVIFR